MSLRKCPIKELTWDAGAVCANHLASAPKLGLYNHSLYADKARSVQYVKVIHSGLSPDAYW